LPNIFEGLKKGDGLHPVCCKAKTPLKEVTQAANGDATHMACKRAGRSAQNPTYEGRTTKSNMVVAKFGADKSKIENAGWDSQSGTSTI
jgi:hypothetical protein